MYKILTTCKGAGYIYCRTSPVHPNANSLGLYPLHRVVAENTIGRPLLFEEDVHHRNGNKFDNAPENLEVLTKSAHGRIHGPKRIDEITITCPACGSSFNVTPREIRLRSNRNKSGRLFCSRSCGSKKLS